MSDGVPSLRDIRLILPGVAGMDIEASPEGLRLVPAALSPARTTAAEEAELRAVRELLSRGRAPAGDDEEE